MTKPARARSTRRLLQPLVEFMQLEASSGVLLMLAAVTAIVWANSPWAPSYFALWETPVSVHIGSFDLTKSALHWINDGLMAVFFFLVGMEIKRELLVGELSTRVKATLPVAAALGGMVVPALIFAAFNAGGPSARGWGIPMATDIAFALGILTLLGPRVPLSLKVFLAALAIVDDLGAVLVIALFYTTSLSWIHLLGGLAIVGVLFLFNRLGVRRPTPYLVLGIVLWVLFLQSGIHATIAGVLLAMTIPTRVHLNTQEFVDRCHSVLEEFSVAGESGERVLISEARQTAIREVEKAAEEVQMPLERIEDALHPWVTYLIMPLFALANAGVVLSGTGLSSSSLAKGVVVGLVVGKPLGIVLFAWLAVRMRLAVLPRGVRWRHLWGVGLMGGIGFTMSLFIAELGLSGVDSIRMAKTSILVASLVAGAVGYGVLRRVTRAPRPS